MIRYTDVRLDANSIKDLPDGSIRVTGQLTRTGVFTYRNPNGTPRVEYRPAEEVFRDDVKSSFAGSTITVGHPGSGDRLVTSKTWKGDSVGHAGDSIRQDGEWLVGDLYVKDASAVAAIKSGAIRYLSCGYGLKYDPTPGTAPDGTRFDGVQRGIVGNHVALLPPGVRPRGGDGCALRLDSNEDEAEPESATTLRYDEHMTPEQIAAMTASLTTAQAQAEALKGELAKARTDAAEVPALKTQLAAAQAEVVTLKAQVAPERLDAMVAERLDLVSVAKTAGVDVKSKTALEIKRLVVAKNTPALASRVDSLDAVALDAVMTSYVALPHPSLSAVVGASGGAPAPAPEAATLRTDAEKIVGVKIPTITELQNKFVQESRKMWKTPVADAPAGV